jgi:ubiquitin C-terminal hydrolase
MIPTNQYIEYFSWYNTSIYLIGTVSRISEQSQYRLKKAAARRARRKRCARGRQQSQIEQPVHQNVMAVAGIGNLGNTCFLAAVLQCQLATPDFKSSMTNVEHYRTCWQRKLGKFCLACAYCELATCPTWAFTIVPTAVVGNLPHLKWGYVSGTQADAEECYTALCDAFERSKRVFKDGPQQYSVSDGMLCCQRTCATCSNVVSLPDEQFQTLHLTATKRTLRQALNTFTAAEPVEDIWCEKCNSHQIRKQTMLKDTQQPVLVMHFQRSVSHPVTGRNTKLQRIIDFPIVLDMLPFILPAAASSAVIDATYELKAVLLHHGSSVGGGHNTAVVERNGKWFHCDDHMTTQMPIQTMRKQQAYMLFYQKRSSKQNTVGGREEKSKTPTLPIILPTEQMHIRAAVVTHVPASGDAKWRTTRTSAPDVLATNPTWAEITARPKNRMIIGALPNRPVPPVPKITSKSKIHLQHGRLQVCITQLLLSITTAQTYEHKDIALRL